MISGDMVGCDVVGVLLDGIESESEHEREREFKPFCDSVEVVVILVVRRILLLIWTEALR